jgi:hypothetical protein
VQDFKAAQIKGKWMTEMHTLQTGAFHFSAKVT